MNEPVTAAVSGATGVETESGGFMVFSTENPDAWILSDTAANNEA